MKSKSLSGLKANNFPLLLLKVKGHGNEKQVTFWVKSKLVFLILQGMIEVNFECEKANQVLSKKQTTFYKYISTYMQCIH